MAASFPPSSTTQVPSAKDSCTRLMPADLSTLALLRLHSPENSVPSGTQTKCKVFIWTPVSSSPWLC